MYVIHFSATPNYHDGNFTLVRMLKSKMNSVLSFPITSMRQWHEGAAHLATDRQLHSLQMQELFFKN